MNTTGRTIAKNASVLMASQVITWGLTLLLTIFLPRYLGATSVGKFHLANSLWAIIVMFSTFGMDTFLTKEIARSPSRASEYLGTSLMLRALLYVVGTAGIVLYALFAGYPTETLYVILIVGTGFFFIVLSHAFEATLNGMERMEFVSLAAIISKAVLTILSIVALLLGQGVLVVASIGIIAALVNLTIPIYYLRRLIPLRIKVIWIQAGPMLKSSFTYLMAFIFLVLYNQVDIVIISLLVNEKTIGWYGAADQLFGTMLFVPTVFITAVFPALSRMYIDASDSLIILMRKSFNLLLIIGVPIGLGILVVANSAVNLLFGSEFAQSGPVLAVMGLVLILTYQNVLLGQFLISTDRQNLWVWVMGAAFLVSIPLDLVLVPWARDVYGNGAIGGAIAYLITETGMLLVGLRMVPKNSLGWDNVGVAVRVFVAGLIMVAATWWARNFIIVVPVAIGAVTYLATILLFRVIPAEDWQLLASVVQSVKYRLRRHTVQPAGGEN